MHNILTPIRVESSMHAKSRLSGQCYPGLFGDQCEECQCVVDISDYENTKQCEKNMYGVFDRDFRTKEYTGECMDSGICTDEPDDCGVVVNGADRCLLTLTLWSLQRLCSAGTTVQTQQTRNAGNGNPASLISLLEVL